MASQIVLSNDPTGRLTRSVARGHALRLARGVYTTDVQTPLEVQVRRDLWRVVRHLLPDAVITDRTARVPAFSPDEPIVVFTAHPRRRRVVKLPGATVVARPGPGPQPEDPPFRDGTRIASEPRALLENARRSRGSSGLPASTLSRAELASWIADLAAARGPQRMNRLRDQARELAGRLDLRSEFAVIDRLIGAALGTEEVPASATAAVRAAHAGRGFDQTRVEQFDDLAGQLTIAHLPRRPQLGPVEIAFSFFEAYFSNFIEGTEFTVDEALEVVFQGASPAGHPVGDAHDVRGTFALVSDPADHARVPADRDDFIELLTGRHRVLMSGRPHHSPGDFKERPNRAGGYVFVAPELVAGTLEQGYTRSLSLPEGAARAIYWLFVLAEIHPFSDGNGRLARLFMNAELSAAAQTRIVIPTAFRYEYLNALRLVSNHRIGDGLIKVCTFAQEWSGAIDVSSVERARAVLEATNAFHDPSDDSATRLLMP